MNLLRACFTSLLCIFWLVKHMIVIAQEENTFAFKYVSSMYQNISRVLEILWKALWARQTFGNRPLITLEVAVQNVAETVTHSILNSSGHSFTVLFILSSKPCTMNLILP